MTQPIAQSRWAARLVRREHEPWSPTATRTGWDSEPLDPVREPDDRPAWLRRSVRAVEYHDIERRRGWR